MSRRRRTPVRQARRGFDAVQDIQKQMKEEAKRNRGRIFQLFLGEDEETEVVFLSDVPILYYNHTVQEGKKWMDVTCTDGSEDGCPHCEAGDKARPRGAFLVLDYRPWEQKIYKDGRDTGKTRELPFSLRMFARGMKDVQPLDIMNKRHGLMKWKWYLNRTGTGTQTAYSFDRGEEVDLTEEDWDDIQTLLPFSMQKHLDVRNPEDMADLVEWNVNPEFTFDWLDEDEDEEEEKPSRRSSRQDRRKSRQEDEYEDDDFDEDEDLYDDEDLDDGVMDIDDEEEEEEAPRKARRRPTRRRTRR